MSKGADTAMYPRLAASNNAALVTETKKHMLQFAEEVSQ